MNAMDLTKINWNIF